MLCLVQDLTVSRASRTRGQHSDRVDLMLVVRSATWAIFQDAEEDFYARAKLEREPKQEVAIFILDMINELANADNIDWPEISNL